MSILETIKGFFVRKAPQYTQAETRILRIIQHAGTEGISHENIRLASGMTKDKIIEITIRLCYEESIYGFCCNKGGETAHKMLYYCPQTPPSIKECGRIYKIINESGKKGISRSKLLRSSKLKAEDLNEHLTRFINAEMIEEYWDNTTGSQRPSVSYRAI